MSVALQQIIDRAASSNEVLSVFIAAVLSILGWLSVKFIVGHSKVVWAFSHQHAFFLKNLSPPILAYTSEIWIQNIGRVVAEDVEIILGSSPQHYDVWPQRQYTEITNPDESIVIKFDHLSSKEFFAISIFQTVNEPPTVNNVRWKGGVGKQVPMGPQQILSRWLVLVIQSFLLFGFFSFWYFLIRIISF